MKQKFIDYFMDVAYRTSELSYATKLKVGSVIVKDTRIISCGYNGLPSGWIPNNCEREIIVTDYEYENLPDKQNYTRCNHGWKTLKTYEGVIHSEANAISRLARSTESGIGAVLFCTHSPCLQCSKLIYGAGIKTVYYKEPYRCSSGISFLKRCGIEIIKYEKSN